MQRYPRWPIHLALLAASFVMLVPFYWVLKTCVSGENIFSYPPSIIPRDPNPFYLRRCLVRHPVRALFPQQRRGLGA